ncbi:MAG: site-2 protease family protein, partial [Candidatus Tectimicrobiota bacterium]
MSADTAPAQSRTSLRLLRIAGIQITMDPSWMIIFLLVLFSLSGGYLPRHVPGQSITTYWLAGLAATVLFFASLLVHELAHALMARRMGLHVGEITLFIFGGVARLSEEARTPRSEWLIAIVGPLTSWLLALTFWLLHLLLESAQPSLPGSVLAYLAWINLAIGIFNLIPGFPLDGGRVLRALLWYRSGSLAQATRIASNIGQGFAFVLMALGAVQLFSGALIGGLWLLFIGMFLRGTARESYQDVMIRQSLAGIAVQDVMIAQVVSVPPELSVSQLLHDYVLRYGYQGFPVRQNGTVTGVVSLEEARQVPEDERSSTSVAQILHPLDEHVTIPPQAPLSEALQKMAREDTG